MTKAVDLSGKTFGKQMKNIFQVRIGCLALVIVFAIVGIGDDYPFIVWSWMDRILYAIAISITLMWGISYGLSMLAPQTDSSASNLPKLKMYCIVSKEAVAKVKGNRGKLLAQSGHAYLHSWWDANVRFRERASGYRNSDHAYKICLVAETDQALQDLFDAYEDVCGVSLVRDAGFTVFNEPTITCLGIGPIAEKDIGEDLKSLKVFI